MRGFPRKARDGSGPEGVSAHPSSAAPSGVRCNAAGRVIVSVLAACLKVGLTLGLYGPLERLARLVQARATHRRFIASMPLQSARMRRPVHRDQFVDADVRVDLGRLQVRVSQHLLDEADVGAAFEHVRRAGVAQQVRGAGLVHAGEAQVALDLVGHLLRLDRLAVVAQEQRLGVASQ